MPYALSEKSLQEKCNNKLMKLAKDLKIKCILTSDSHFGSKDDFDTYLKMHEIGGHLELGKEYSERYMPSEKEIIDSQTWSSNDPELYKNQIRLLAQHLYDKEEVNAEEIFCLQKMMTARLKNELPEFIKIRKIITQALDRGIIR